MLIASWTLNVALGVAFFLKTRYPAGGYWHSGEILPGGFCPGVRDGLVRMPGMNRQMREEIAPLKMERKRLLLEMAEIFASERLDTTRLECVEDSLDRLNRVLQERQIHHMKEMHGALPPHARRELVPRMMRRMGDMRGMRYEQNSERNGRWMRQPEDRP